jgi:AcrR family transcriptional regulator
MRKSPQQARSREMVDRIVLAGRAVLVRDGYAAFSTNRIAAEAGVSPGSLYQYFGDKATILDVIVDRYWDDVSAQVVAALGDRLGAVDLATIRAVADALLGALESDPALLQVIDEELPRRRFRERRLALETRVTELLVVLMVVQDAQDAQVDRPTANAIAWTIVQSLQGLTTRWVVDRPAVSRDVLLDQIVALIAGYLPVTLGK